MKSDYIYKKSTEKFETKLAFRISKVADLEDYSMENQIFGFLRNLRNNYNEDMVFRMKLPNN